MNFDLKCRTILLEGTPLRGLYSGMKKNDSSQNDKHDVVQVKNPRSGHYVKIDRTEGKILSHKKSDGPYKGVPVARKRK